MKIKFLFFLTVFIHLTAFSMDHENPVILSTRTYKESTLAKVRYLVSALSLAGGIANVYYQIKNHDYSFNRCIISTSAFLTSLACLSKHDLLSLLPFYHIQDFEREDAQELIEMQKNYAQKYLPEEPDLSDELDRPAQITSIEENYFNSVHHIVWKLAYNNNNFIYKTVELDALRYAKTKANEEKTRRLKPVYERYKLKKPFYLRFWHWLLHEKPKDCLQENLDFYRNFHNKVKKIPISRHALICDLFPYLMDPDVEFNAQNHDLLPQKWNIHRKDMHDTEYTEEDFRRSNLYSEINSIKRTLDYFFDDQIYEQDTQIFIPDNLNHEYLLNLLGIEESKVTFYKP